MNGPMKMYETRQIIRHDFQVSLPECMFKMRNVHATSDETGALNDHVFTTTKSADISKQNLQKEDSMGTLINRQEKILKQLDELRQQMILLKTELSMNEKVKQPKLTAQSYPLSNSPKIEIPNIVINASPTYPPWSLLVIQKLIGKLLILNVKTHIHSTVLSLSEQATALTKALEGYTYNNENQPIADVRLIWKDVGPNTELMISQTPIIGEVNILRYFTRLFPHCLAYEILDNLIEVDSVLDVCYSLVRAKTKTERHSLIQFLNKQLGKSEYLCCKKEHSIADVAASSAIKQVASGEINQNMMKWLQRCDAIKK